MTRFDLRIAVALVLCFTAPVRGQQNSVEAKLDQVLAEVRQLRKLLENRRGPSGTPMERAAVDVGNAPVLGSKDAPLTIVEFTDYQCPYCRHFHERTFTDLKRHYIDTGKVRFYVKDLPGANHPDALRAAQAAHCAREADGKFWPLHERMQTSQDGLGLEQLVAHAEAIGMDSSSFRSCLESGRYEEAVKSAVRDAFNLGVQGTPTFLIGTSTRGGVEGEWVVGALPFGVFQQKLDEYDAAINMEGAQE